MYSQLLPLLATGFLFNLEQNLFVASLPEIIGSSDVTDLDDFPKQLALVSHLFGAGAAGAVFISSLPTVPEVLWRWTHALALFGTISTVLGLVPLTMPTFVALRLFHGMAAGNMLASARFLMNAFVLNESKPFYGLAASAGGMVSGFVVFDLLRTYFPKSWTLMFLVEAVIAFGILVLSFLSEEPTTKKSAIYHTDVSLSNIGPKILVSSIMSVLCVLMPLHARHHDKNNASIFMFMLPFLISFVIGTILATGSVRQATIMRRIGVSLQLIGLSCLVFDAPMFHVQMLYGLGLGMFHASTPASSLVVSLSMIGGSVALMFATLLPSQIYVQVSLIAFGFVAELMTFH